MEKAVVLVVENEALIRISALHMVEDAGFAVAQACDADEAIRILESRNDIRAVFTDIKMPGSMDGWELVGVISARWPPIHLIVASALVPNRDKLPTNGRFLRKPYTSEDVTAALYELFGHHPTSGPIMGATSQNCAKLVPTMSSCS